MGWQVVIISRGNLFENLIGIEMRPGMAECLI